MSLFKLFNENIAIKMFDLIAAVKTVDLKKKMNDFLLLAAQKIGLYLSKTILPLIN